MMEDTWKCLKLWAAALNTVHIFDATNNDQQHLCRVRHCEYCLSVSRRAFQELYWNIRLDSYIAPPLVA
jgi:hypothetical protein